jgi:hypothetical protein
MLAGVSSYLEEILRAALILCTFAFPVGVWLVLLGYELPSAFLLITGWTAMVLLTEQGGSK